MLAAETRIDNRLRACQGCATVTAYARWPFKQAASPVQHAMRPQALKTQHMTWTRAVTAGVPPSLRMMALQSTLRISHSSTPGAERLRIRLAAAGARAAAAGARAAAAAALRIAEHHAVLCCVP